MKYYRFFCETPYCGTDETIYVTYSDDTPEDEILGDCEDWAYSVFDNFSYLATGWPGCSDSEEEETILENYYDNCWCDFCEVTREEYDEFCDND